MAWVLGPVQRASLLHAVQLQQCFSDSKHFVDMPLKPGKSPEALMTAFRALPKPASGDELPSKADLLKLVQEFFMEPATDLLTITPPEMSEAGPAWISNLPGADLQSFARAVYRLWQLLYRRTSDEVAGAPGRFSLLALPHPFAIAGDRFRECYYWDSYWILRGFMACGMRQAATGVLLNMLHLVHSVGHVPNGTRCYYTNRSQPPLLSAMVMLVSGLHPTGPHNGAANQHILSSTEHGSTCESHVDTALLQQALPALIKTWRYWRSGGKAVRVRGRAAGVLHLMSRYKADWDAPRPESYREDWELAASRFDLTSGEPSAGARQLWCELASGAESGWDYSSRWLTDAQDLATIRTTQIIPADLNAFLAMLASDISAIAHVLGDTTTCDEFRQHATDLWEAINSLMWCDRTGTWCDLCVALSAAEQLSSSDSAAAVVTDVQLVRQVLASSWVPLWAGAAPPGSDQAAAAVTGLWTSGLVQAGGVMTSLVETGQQWDAPNCWPPLQHMSVEGVKHAGVAGCEQKASQLAGTWLHNACLAYQQSGHMFEKFNALKPGVTGGGGEYEPQVGFGWTNGAVLDLLSQGYLPHSEHSTPV